MPRVSVPSGGRVKGAATDFGYGLGGGAVYSLGTRTFGNGLIGGAIAAVAAGSLIEGSTGDIIATMAGFAAANDPSVQNVLSNIPTPNWNL